MWLIISSLNGLQNLAIISIIIPHKYWSPPSDKQVYTWQKFEMVIEQLRPHPQKNTWHVKSWPALQGVNKQKTKYKTPIKPNGLPVGRTLPKI